MDRSTLGEKLISKNITQDDICDIIGVYLQFVLDYEPKGKERFFMLDLIEDAGIFACSLELRNG